MFQVETTFPGGDWTEQLVAHSLAEDVGPGDATTLVTATPGAEARAEIVARHAGILAGGPLLDLLYRTLEPKIGIERLLADGAQLVPGQVVARLNGPVAGLLTGERTALNFLQHLSGIATLTGRYVRETAGTSCRVLDTRKTLPGYRHLAKYAVRCGGGHNHRMGLYDRIMLKDNHWAAGGGSVAELVQRARDRFPNLAVEVEVDTREQLQLVLPLGVEWILLDNFSVAATHQAVLDRNAAGSDTRLEASGNVTLETIGAYARAGVDAASVGRLTHSAPAFDLGMDMAVHP